MPVALGQVLHVTLGCAPGTMVAFYSNQLLQVSSPKAQWIWNSWSLRGIARRLARCVEGSTIVSADFLFEQGGGVVERKRAKRMEHLNLQPSNSNPQAPTAPVFLDVPDWAGHACVEEFTERYVAASCGGESLFLAEFLSGPCLPLFFDVDISSKEDYTQPELRRLSLSHTNSKASSTHAFRNLSQINSP